MASVFATICTNRSSALLAECLGALVAQAPASRIIVVANTRDGASYETLRRQVDHLAAGARTIHEPRQGLSHARNAALAACADDDVVAYIDDDAVVGEGWWAAMNAAWDGAAADVACVGGPIRPRFLAPRPRWLSDDLLTVLTVLDYGPDPLELDPSERTVYGANVSFRAGLVRAVGGFDPRHGPQGTRPGFGDEDAVERALAAAGYTIRYEPAAWLWHLIPAERLRRTALLRRRYEYGRMVGASAQTPARVAAWQAARSSVGVAVALARRDETLAVDRLVRAIENGAMAVAAARSRPLRAG